MKGIGICPFLTTNVAVGTNQDGDTYWKEICASFVLLGGLASKNNWNPCPIEEHPGVIQVAATTFRLSIEYISVVLLLCEPPESVFTYEWLTMQQVTMQILLLVSMLPFLLAGASCPAESNTLVTRTCPTTKKKNAKVQSKKKMRVQLPSNDHHCTNKTTQNYTPLVVLVTSVYYY